MTPPGYGTPFYMGDVVDISLDAAGSSTEAPSTPRAIVSLRVHYRMPLLRDRFCDEVTRPWKLACIGHHEWSGACTKSCKRLILDGAASSRMVVTVEANTVFETKLGLKPVDKGLDMATKRRIAEHIRDPDWANKSSAMSSALRRAPVNQL